MGEEEFSCPNPEKGVCVSAKTAYEFAEDSEKIQRFESRQTNVKTTNEDDESSEINFEINGTTVNSTKDTLRNIAPVVGTISTPLLQPKPVLEQAKVLRVWVNTWEDKKGVLHMPQFSYVEITPRKWALGEKANGMRHKASSPFTVVN